MIKLGQQLIKRSSLTPVTAAQKATHKKVLDTMRTVLERVNFARRVNKRTVSDAKLSSMFFEVCRSLAPCFDSFLILSSIPRICSL